MTRETEDLEKLTRELAQAYFIKRDYPTLLRYISPEISVFGTGINEVCYGISDLIRYLGQEQELYTGQFLINNETYRATMLTGNSACVMAEMDIRADPASGYFVDLHHRFTIFYTRKVGGRWMLCHLHDSVPYQNQGDAIFFDRTAARSDYERMEEMARAVAAERVAAAKFLDPLTGIYNLTGFVNQAQTLIRQHRGTQYVVMEFHIDHFRYLNQTNGYDAGDKLLINVAKKLASNCAITETCGHTEKDTFAALMEFQSEEHMAQRMDYLSQILVDSETRAQQKIPIYFTGGLYLPDRDSYEQVKEMLDKALTALKSVKKDERKSSYAYFSPQDYATQTYRTHLAELAPEAMARGEFKLYIHPQVDLDRNEVVGGEALVRWIRPDGTLIMPNDFISLFEQEGQIVPLDFYMLDLICRHLRQWLDQGLRPLPISVNQSRLHLKNTDYLDQFRAVVDSYQIPHRLIRFELTESAFIEEREAMFELARALHKMDFVLELDDFGSGYASLDLLTTLSADVLKLDRSLVIGLDTRNSKNYVVLKKIIEMAHATDMTVICEGAETRRQVRCLREMGCDIVQGFYFYRPMPAAVFEQTVLQPTPDPAVFA